MRKTLSLILAGILVVSLFAGCNNESTTPSETPNQTNAPDVSPDTLFDLPLAEPLDLRIWHTFTSTIIASMNESEFTTEVARRLGINLKWEEAADTNAAEVFSLMLVSDDLPDLIKPPADGLPALGGSGDAAIENQIAIPINDLSAYYPNYQAYIDGNETIQKLTVTDEGNMWGFHVILKEPEGPWTGLAYRKDFAEKAGYTKTPSTIQDWDDMLSAMRDSGVETPLAVSNNGLWMFGAPIMSAYDVSYDWFVKDGQVSYSYIEDGFKDYLTLMNKWYNEKLIDQEFISRGYNVMSILSEDYFRTDVGAMQSVFSFTRSAMHSSYGFSDNPDFWLEPVAAPTLNEGDTLKINYPNTYVQAMPLMITTSNEHPEISSRLADYFYTEEGFILANYGIEGVSFKWDGDYPRATDLLLNDEQGREFTRLKAQWCWLQGVGLYTYLQSKDDMADQAVYDAYDIWNVGEGEWNYPTGATLTTTESSSYSSVYADIQTYVSETVVKFIVGDMSIDEFDTFTNQIKSMGIDNCISIKQASYDRYMNR